MLDNKKLFVFDNVFIFRETHDFVKNFFLCLIIKSFLLGFCV